MLRFGSIPLVWQADDPKSTLEAYLQLYVREEIRAEAIVRNLPRFLRFLPVAALFHGQVINVAGLARDAATARTTVEGYLGILQDTLFVTILPAFEARLRVRERRHPKLYWVDPGVVRAAKQSRFSTPQLSGLRAIADLPRLVRRVLVYLGDRRLKTEDGIEVWPLDALLTAIAGDMLWP